MELILAYTTTDNKKLELKKTEVKSNEFKNNVGYVTLNDTEIPYGLFESQYTLKRVVIPNGVTEIGAFAFIKCVELTSLEIPNGVTSIAHHAFYGCESLTSIEIPNSVTSIGDSAFQGCTSLTSIVVESGNSVYDSRNNCNAIIRTSTNTLIQGCDNTIIPSGVTSIGDSAFCCCKGLTSVVIPNSVTSIGDCAFDCCIGLTNIEIQNGVTSIGDYAFGHCKNLTSIKIPNNVKSIGCGSFNYCSNLPCNQFHKSKRSILAYKGFDKDMTCRRFKFEIGKPYHEDKAKTCDCGFHACLNPIDVLSYYPNRHGHKFALVELSGDIDFNKCGDSKVAATDIKIVKELTFEDLINEFNRLNK